MTREPVERWHHRLLGVAVTEETVFARPWVVESLDECEFYHTMDLPRYGTVQGQWDLRVGLGEYLGRVDFRAKRVLDVGTASGCLAFWMERAGAEVVGYDISDAFDWDVVPFDGLDVDAEQSTRKKHIARLNNSFWLAHRALRSSVQVAYGSVYAIPETIGRFDVAVLGSILLHLRDPFRALEQALRLTRETVVVTDALPRRSLLVPAVARWFGPCAEFLPNGATRTPTDSWWRLTPALVVRMLGVLGFGNTRVTLHSQLFKGRPQRLFTVVGQRAAGPDRNPLR